MGPHVFACGNPAASSSGRSELSRLQWGRTFLRAEICSTRTVRSFSFASFNGAARFCVRKCEIKETLAIEEMVLQWGRTFLRAEITTDDSSLTLAVELQWGRTFLRAEMKTSPTGSIAVEQLQWGRTFLRAEI